MSQILVRDLTFSYDTAYDNIFEHVSFLIDTDWRLGFIGRNGKGKTTLLKLLLGKYEYQGSITATVNFDYFPFEVANTQKSTLQIMKDIIAPYSVWEAEMEHCIKEQEKIIELKDKSELQETKIADIEIADIEIADTEIADTEIADTEIANTEIANTETALQEVMERYGQLLDLYQAHDGYQIEELIEKELAKLKVESTVLTRAFSTLSFGERTKVMLVALFLKKNNFLLIDEPTNHLDRQGRETLAEYLQSKKGFILVSHDRAFLDACIDHVISINRADIEIVKGNYSSWRENRDLQDQYELDKNEQLKKDIGVLSEAAKRMAGWSDQIEASKIGAHVGDRGFVGHKSAKMMKRAKAVERRKIDAIEEKKGLLKNLEQSVPLKLNMLPFPKKRLIEAEDISLFYGEREIAANINFLLEGGDRIAIEGRNGSGKTTLFKLLLGEDVNYKGRYHVAQGLKISYVSQDTTGLQGNLKEYAFNQGIDETIFKTVLRQLDFDRNQFDKDISEFSAGQKKKVLLAKSLSEPAHIFLWDEPLNYIDVFSRLQIEELILKYQATMIFIEHDKLFQEKIATKVVRL
ncbi:MAG: hypothetical protein K0R00_4099 [Herbinix sp.]|jgi:lincosamide and streptogramin A transport system ATP-binding/permease protein|nr:hypothetical protein [Herbinix sp.]